MSTIGFLVWICVILSTVSSEQVDRAVVLTLSTSAAQEGHSLLAECNVSNPSSSPFALIWFRYNPVDRQEVEIATNEHVNDAFRLSGRYEARMEKPIPDSIRLVVFRISISNVQVADTGDIGCRVPAGSGEGKLQTVQPFIVQVPVKRVWWSSANMLSLKTDSYSSGQKVDFKEDEKWELICHVNGSYPAPSVRVFLGNKDITDTFMRVNTLQKGEGPKGLQSVYYSVTVSQTYNITYDWDSKALSCVAQLLQSGESMSANGAQSPLSANVHIALSEYRPKFLCNETQMARHNEPYFALACRLRALPDVNDVKFWTGADEHEFLRKGERKLEFNANTSQGQTEHETIMTLTIDRVLKQHFRNYTFEATNRVGVSKQKLQLVQEQPSNRLSSTGSCADQFATNLPKIASFFALGLLHFQTTIISL